MDSGWKSPSSSASGVQSVLTAVESVVDFEKMNQDLRALTPAEVVEWGVKQGVRPLVTTNFGPLESTLLHLCTSVVPSMPVVWCDSGYNTKATYRHADALTKQLSLNLSVYLPRQSAAHWDACEGGVPDMSDNKHERFTQLVKLEPFKRALSEHQPDVWFTNIRKTQTAFRGTLDIVSDGGEGVIRVSPFFHWTDEELEAYLQKHALVSEGDYYDPTKVLEHRECGLHLRGASDA